MTMFTHEILACMWTSATADLPRQFCKSRHVATCSTYFLSIWTKAERDCTTSMHSKDCTTSMHLKDH